MVTMECRRCTWEITLPSEQAAAAALMNHHRRSHTLEPSGHEAANNMIEEEISRQYAASDQFGKLKPRTVKGATDRNAPKPRDTI